MGAEAGVEGRGEERERQAALFSPAQVHSPPCLWDAGWFPPANADAKPSVKGLEAGPGLEQDSLRGGGEVGRRGSR